MGELIHRLDYGYYYYHELRYYETRNHMIMILNLCSRGWRGDIVSIIQHNISTTWKF